MVEHTVGIGTKWIQAPLPALSGHGGMADTIALRAIA